ncbi:hypothetical protein C3B59_18405 [Cryobacterium zongtaii]|uniref:Uncharacterized protein n=1 Tax=Cryobacterium zongtaii TaxID=1259217 RepID=A0A2S3Z521_9MICO|nr:hypothetical protein C3B59_18405 [Cryobacterium zongtaii]
MRRVRPRRPAWRCRWPCPPTRRPRPAARGPRPRRRSGAGVCAWSAQARTVRGYPPTKVTEPGWEPGKSAGSGLAHPRWSVEASPRGVVVAARVAGRGTGSWSRHGFVVAARVADHCAGYCARVGCAPVEKTSAPGQQRETSDRALPPSVYAPPRGTR